MDPTAFVALPRRKTLSEVYKTEFLRYLNAISGPYRYSPTKFQHLLKENWPAIRRIVEGEVVAFTPVFLEIHVAEPCNLSCEYCRGQLREVPETQRMMSRTELLDLVDAVFFLNPMSFIRFSGLIGEPLLHPNIAEVFERANSYSGLSWALSTNGVFLDKAGVSNALMGSEYAHISLDAGSDETYQALKKGKPGDFDRVMSNLDALVSLRSKRKSSVKIIVSLLIQEENHQEIANVSSLLQAMQVDTLELKMQHYDSRRTMKPEVVDAAFASIERIRRGFRDDQSRIVVVQSRSEAMKKLQPPTIDFGRCYANQLGLNTTIDPRGNVQSCCQYYQGTLGIQGHVSEGLHNVWYSGRRESILDRDPRNHCVNCSPSDQFVNQFVQLLRAAQRLDPQFIEWAEEQIGE